MIFENKFIVIFTIYEHFTVDPDPDLFFVNTGPGNYNSTPNVKKKLEK
jgi:hypothetical protein